MEKSRIYVLVTAFLAILFCIFTCSVKNKITTYESPNVNIWRDGEWIVSVGECLSVDKTPDEAVTKALYIARVNAIRYECGEEIVNWDVIYQNPNHTSFSSFIQTRTYGLIVDEKEPLIKPVEYARDKYGAIIYNYVITLYCKVKKREGDVDHEFNIFVELNRLLYKIGNGIRINVKVEMDCYVTVCYIYDKEDKAIILFPYEYSMDNFVEAHEKKTFPPPGVTWAANLPPGIAEETHSIMVIATKEKRDFTAGLKKENDTAVTSVMEMYRRLSNVPLHIITIAYQPIHIRK